MSFLLALAAICIGCAALPGAADTLLDALIDLDRKCRLVGCAITAMAGALILELTDRLSNNVAP